jgi:hypothetical protein
MVNWEGSQQIQVTAVLPLHYSQHKRRRENDSTEAVYK